MQALQQMDAQAFTNAVFQSIRNPNRSVAETAALRDPALLMRTSDAIDVLVGTTKAGIESLATSTDPTAPSKVRYRQNLLARLRAEQAVVRPMANEARESEAQRTRGKGPRHRAMVRLSREPDLQVRFLHLVREEQDRDRACGVVFEDE